MGRKGRKRESGREGSTIVGLGLKNQVYTSATMGAIRIDCHIPSRNATRLERG
jgi:hypothetical protein